MAVGAVAIFCSSASESLPNSTEEAWLEQAIALNMPTNPKNQRMNNWYRSNIKATHFKRLSAATKVAQSESMPAKPPEGMPGYLPKGLFANLTWR
jgi:hypothetical protein